MRTFKFEFDNHGAVSPQGRYQSHQKYVHAPIQIWMRNTARASSGRARISNRYGHDICSYPHNTQEIPCRSSRKTGLGFRRRKASLQCLNEPASAHEPPFPSSCLPRSFPSRLPRRCCHRMVCHFISFPRHPARLLS